MYEKMSMQSQAFDSNNYSTAVRHQEEHLRRDSGFYNNNVVFGLGPESYVSSKDYREPNFVDTQGKPLFFSLSINLTRILSYRCEPRKDRGA